VNEGFKSIQNVGVICDELVRSQSRSREVCDIVWSLRRQHFLLALDYRPRSI